MKKINLHTLVKFISHRVLAVMALCLTVFSENAWSAGTSITVYSYGAYFDKNDVHWDFSSSSMKITVRLGYDDYLTNQDMTLTDYTYLGFPIYSYTFTEKNGGAEIWFKHYQGETEKEAYHASDGDWIGTSDITGKMYLGYSAGKHNWVAYSTSMYPIYLDMAQWNDNGTYWTADDAVFDMTVDSEDEVGGVWIKDKLYAFSCTKANPSKLTFKRINSSRSITWNTISELDYNSSYNTYKVTGWTTGACTEDNINLVNKTTRVYFDNSYLGLYDTYKYFVIGHDNFTPYSKVYNATANIANTKLLYYELSSDVWRDATYYGFIGSGSSYDGTGWGSSNLSSAEKYTAAYKSQYDLKEGDVNLFYTSESGNNKALSITNQGTNSSSLNTTQAIKYSISRDGGSTYAELNSGVTPAQITISAYKFVDDTYNSVTNTSNSQSVSAGQSSTYTTSVPAAYTGATSISYTSKRDGYTFIGWYDAASGGSTISSPFYPKAEGTVYARFKAHRYNIKFDANDDQYPGTASGSTAQISNVVYDQSQTLTANGFSRVGYTFAGWATTAAGSVAYTDEESVSNLSSTDGDDVTLYAKWTVNPYRVDVASVDHVTISTTSPSIAEGAYANANYGATVTLSYSELGSDYIWGGWNVYKTGDESTTVTASSNQFTMPDYAVTVSAVLYQNPIAWCDPDIDITGDIHLTSSKDVYVQDITSLLTISSEDLGSATSLEISYLDGSDEAVEAANSLFRLCADGTSSYSEIDYSPIDVSASREYEENYSIKYTPNAYGQLDNGKVVITAKKGDYTLKSVTKEVNGRALPEEFVIASKHNSGQWYALPNTLATNTEKTATPIPITVDNTTTPTAVLYAPAETIYKGAARKTATSNVASIRLTNDGSHWLITAGAPDKNGIGLSTTETPGYEDREVWHLKSSNFGAYKLEMDPSQGPTKQLGMYGTNMGYYASPTSPSGDIYILPANISYFIGGASGHEDEWNQTDNWESGSLPTTSSIVRVLAPLKIATGEKWHVAEMDIVTGGTTSHYKSGASACEGNLEIAAGGELITTGTVKKCADAEKFASLSATGERDIIIRSNGSNGLGALVMGNHDGTNKATVYFATLSKGSTETEEEANESVSQYVGTPFCDESTILYNWYNSWVYGITYDDSGNIDWERINSDQGMAPFKGYAVISAYPAGHVYEMSGSLNPTTNKTMDGLNWQSGTSTNPNNENLLANSWMAPIKISKFIEGDFENTDAAIYIFNSGSPDDYENKPGSGAGQYETYTPGTSDDDEDVIPAMQSFSVYTNATGGSSVTLDYKRLVYDPAVATGDDHAAIIPNKAPRRAKAEGANKMKLFVKAANGYGDMLYMWEHADFAAGFENGWDGRKVFGETTAPQLYAITPDGNMAINCVPTYEGVVMGFQAGDADNVYTFTFECDDAADALYLYDTETQAYTRVLSTNSYQFVTTDKAAHNRFILTRNMPQTPTGIESSAINYQPSVQKVLINNHIYIIRSGKIYRVDGALAK